MTWSGQPWTGWRVKALDHKLQVLVLALAQVHPTPSGSTLG